MVSRVHESLCSPSLGYRPVDGRYPTTPQNEAGRVIEPPVSVPRLKGTVPSATVAALPPLDPPVDRSGINGVSTSTVGGVVRGDAERKLVHVCLSDYNGTCFSQQADHRGVHLGHVTLQKWATRGRGHTRHIDVVLDRKRNAGEFAVTERFWLIGDVYVSGM